MTYFQVCFEKRTYVNDFFFKHDTVVTGYSIFFLLIDEDVHDFLMWWCSDKYNIYQLTLQWTNFPSILYFPENFATSIDMSLVIFFVRKIQKFKTSYVLLWCLICLAVFAWYFTSSTEGEYLYCIIYYFKSLMVCLKIDRDWILYITYLLSHFYFTFRYTWIDW